jgi:hypothetical protein
MDEIKNKKNIRRPNPMAKDLMNPKYRPKVIPDKKRPAIRKKKHKGEKEQDES